MNEFDQKAQSWDKNKMHVERTVAIASQIKKIIPFRHQMRAMEFGAGTGLLSFQLKELFSEITLMDNSQEMLNMAMQKMEKEDFIKFKPLFFDLEANDYSEGSFDIIYSQMVLHHIKDIYTLITKFNQMLTPSGFVAVADLYPEDGSFHQEDMTVHHGIDPEILSQVFLQQGFVDITITPSFTIRKEISENKFKDYPLFLLTARMNT